MAKPTFRTVGKCRPTNAWDKNLRYLVDNTNDCRGNFDQPVCSDFISQGPPEKQNTLTLTDLEWRIGCVVAEVEGFSAELLVKFLSRSEDWKAEELSVKCQSLVRRRWDEMSLLSSEAKNQVKFLLPPPLVLFRPWGKSPLLNPETDSHIRPETIPNQLSGHP